MTSTDRAVRVAAIAGLLHDVGKFTLRAGRGGNRIWDEQAKRDFKYKHAMLSASVVDEATPQPWKPAVAAAVGNHHRPRQEHVGDLAVALADHLSAAERDAHTADDEVERTKPAGHPQQLLSIFAQVKADGYAPDALAQADAYVPLKPLVMTHEALFPGPALNGMQVWKAYDALYTEFEAAATVLRKVYEPDGDMDAYLESLLLLMQRTTWSVPAAYYKTTPDISLYDHSRTSAALAALLVAEGSDAATLGQWLAKPEDAPTLAVLVAADVSGIQEFLYTISSSGATSALRGRSFYLQMLTEVIARYVLRRLGLPITNLLYAGGGNFYLLVAPKHRELLPELQREIARILVRHHRGTLYVALASADLVGRDFFGGEIAKAWERVSEKLQRAKLRRFGDLEAAELQRLFAPQEDGGKEDKECQVCGVEHPGTREVVGVRKCPACRSQEQLGKELRRARFLLLEEVESAETAIVGDAGDRKAVFAAFGTALALFEDIADVRLRNGARGTLLALDDEALVDLHPGARLAVGRRVLANATPILSPQDAARLRADPAYKKDEGEVLEAGAIKPFSALVYDATGIKRLGVLRMDVDNLGKLFAEGLGTRATLSRVASLSFAMSLYFEGWVDRIARDEALRDHVYCIYSGGDDLFFVGAWDKIVTFAQRVRGDFTRYVAGHPGLHTSAGIALAAAKYPLAQAASDAGDAEHKAKAARRAENGRLREKDAVCFLGSVQPWTRFGLDLGGKPGLTTAYALMCMLVKMVEREENAAPRSLVRQLVRLALDYEEAAERRSKEGDDRTRTGEAQALWGPWLWQGVYQLARMASRTKDASARQGIDQLRDYLRRGESVDMAWIGLAARWAELLVR